MKNVINTLLLTVTLCISNVGNAMHRAKQFVKFADKAVAGGLFASYLYQDNKNKAASYHACEPAPQNAQIIAKNLCQKMDIDFSTIELRQMRGWDNALAYSTIIGKNYIVVGSENFNRPVEQQYGLIAHELGHIKHNHAQKELIVRGGIYLANTLLPLRLGHVLLTKACTGLQKISLNKNLVTSHNIFEKLYSILFPLKSLALPSHFALQQAQEGIIKHYEYKDGIEIEKVEKATLHKLLAYYRRCCEKQADITSALN